MPRNRIVLLGNGIAALSALESIRRVDAGSDITVVSDEPGPAYSKVLIPYFISGEKADIGIRTEAYYRDRGVSTIFGRRAVEIGDNTLILDDASRLTWDKLLLATGAAPTAPDIAGGGAPGVFTISTMNDARRIKEHVGEARSVVFLGGGRMCLHVIDAFLKKKLKVTIIESEDEILLSMLDRSAAHIVRASLERRGVEIRANRRVLRILTDGDGVSGVACDDGSEIDADTVVVSVGTTPSISLPECRGVSVNHGVLVDTEMRTDVEGIYAAGDVAESSNLLREGERIVCGTWFEAVRQGRTAGRSISGNPVAYPGSLRMNVIDVDGIAAVSIGEIEPPSDECDVEVSSNGESYRKIIIENDRVIGVVQVGDVTDAGTLASIMAKKTPLTRFGDQRAKFGLNYGRLVRTRRQV